MWTTLSTRVRVDQKEVVASGLKWQNYLFLVVGHFNLFIETSKLAHY